MHLFLPIAGGSVDLAVLLALGGCVGFLSGMFGVGGGFLMTPLLMMVGIPPTVAAASDSCQIAAASASGTFAHARMGNVDYKLGGLMLVGGIGGGALGVQAVKLLRRVGNADFVIMATYVLVLGLIGSYMFAESWRSLRGVRARPHPAKPAAKRGGYGRLVAALPFQMDFPKSGIRYSVLVPIALCMLVGVLAAIMGVGGGFIMIPAMVYLLRMPMHVAVGTDLFQILFTCSGITFMQANSNHTVDFILAMILAVGSTIGAQVGARVARRLRGEQLRIILSVIVLTVAVKMVHGLMATPAVLLSYAKGH
jgi:uncharacterized membrane protein YfcA